MQWPSPHGRLSLTPCRTPPIAIGWQGGSGGSIRAAKIAALDLDGSGSAGPHGDHLSRHDSGAYVKFTPARADLFA
jgi:hypothetical protein